MDFAQTRDLPEWTLIRSASRKALLAVTGLVLFASVNFVHGAVPYNPPPPAIITLAWDPSPSTNVNGYNVYYGTAPGTYSYAINVGPFTNCVVTNLTRGTTYYFCATALDRNGMESDYSAELPYTPPTTVRPRLNLNRKTTGEATISCTGIQNYSYTVLASENMISWNNVATVTANSLGYIEWTDSSARSLKRRYYRLQQLTP